jgi:hypothetical protein
MEIDNADLCLEFIYRKVIHVGSEAVGSRFCFLQQADVITSQWIALFFKQLCSCELGTSFFLVSVDVPTRCYEVLLQKFVLRWSIGFHADVVLRCWVDDEQKQVQLRANHNLYMIYYANRLKGFAIHQLPKTFRDAIKVTQALGRNVLWIDALCIIQAGQGADDEDWKNEAGNTMC